MKSEAVSALPKLRRGLGGADYEECFLKDAGHDRVYCFRLAPKVRLLSDSENDRQSLGSVRSQFSTTFSEIFLKGSKLKFSLFMAHY